jgi:hypothetical protein
MVPWGHLAITVKRKNKIISKLSSPELLHLVDVSLDLKSAGIQTGAA